MAVKKYNSKEEQRAARSLRESEVRRRNKVKAILCKGGGCSACGIKYDGTNAPIFDFHHLNENEKEANPASLMKNRWETIEAEINKCVLLCSNCHRMQHSPEF